MNYATQIKRVLGILLKTTEASFSPPNLKRIGYPKNTIYMKYELKCEICGGDGTIKLKDGTIRKGGLRILNKGKDGCPIVDLRNRKNWRCRCFKCRNQEERVK